MLKRKQSQPLVLVVEDEPLVRLDITLAMVDAGFAVIEVPDAEQALELLQTRKSIGLVFTDVELAGKIDGLELASRVKSDWPHIKVMVTSGQATPDREVADDFIPKPYNTQAVVSHARALAA
ncbi:response regulator [Pelagibacterium sp. H642]|uniref:response regulator n=1 Tax=Pelagibacterium sp. H642 TaxID=1881069 RepID=UPI002815D0CC|nr:response regulator [Pelagibacterium sp. H642]WMT92229.1 response regulator [Pelagibacterium sp. H642]